MKQEKRIRNQLNIDNKMITDTIPRYFTILIIMLILSALLLAVSFADTDSISQDPDINKKKIGWG